MKFGDYLRKSQPFVYRTFERAAVQRKIAHAYLLSGEPGTPLLETALFLAQSLICDHPNPLACEECRSCERIAHGTYADFYVLGDDKGIFERQESEKSKGSSIKKEQVSSIIADFARTPLEEKGVSIYIIHRVEAMTPEAVNGILKFLEEPPEHTYAFLTSENEARVLPTIVSRCERLRMLLEPRKEVIAEAISLGVEAKDAELLSYFINSAALIQKEIEEDSYQTAKESFEKALIYLSYEEEEALFAFEKDIISSLDVRGDKAKPKYFLDMLSLAFKDAVSITQNQPVLLSSYATMNEEIAEKRIHLEESLVEIMRARNLIDTNMNVGLILEHLIRHILKGE